MVQLTDLSPLAQASWAISCNTENKWYCDQVCKARQWSASLYKPQESRTQLYGRMRFDELKDRPDLLCHIGITDRRGQGPDGKFQVTPYNQTKPCPQQSIQASSYLLPTQ